MGIGGEGEEMRACIDIPMTHDTILGRLLLVVERNSESI